MSSQTDMKLLNRIGDYANRFSTLYICPSRQMKKGSSQDTDLESHFPGHSYGTMLSVPKKKASKPLRPPAIHNVLNAYAYNVLKFDSHYMYVQTTPDMFGPKNHSFLVRRKTFARMQEDQAQDKVCLKELNRLARLFEMSSGQAEIYPCYTPRHYAPTILDRVRYGKGFSSPFLHKLRTWLNLNPGATFVKAFPCTAKPRVIMHLGMPKLDKDVFNSLLEYKSSQIRSYFHIQHTPMYLVRHLVHWINSVLRTFCSRSTPATPKPRGKKAIKISDTVSESDAPANARNIPVFVPESNPPEVEYNSSVYALFKPVGMVPAEVKEPFDPDISPPNIDSICDILTYWFRDCNKQPKVTQPCPVDCDHTRCSMLSAEALVVSGTDDDGEYFDLISAESFEEILHEGTIFVPSGFGTPRHLRDLRKFIQSYIRKATFFKEYSKISTVPGLFGVAKKLLAYLFALRKPLEVPFDSPEVELFCRQVFVYDSRPSQTLDFLRSLDMIVQDNLPF
jgi:hypothetical protein